jgi:hypothetical protein
MKASLFGVEAGYGIHDRRHCMKRQQLSQASGGGPRLPCLLPGRWPDHIVGRDRRLAAGGGCGRTHDLDRGTATAKTLGDEIYID